MPDRPDLSPARRLALLYSTPAQRAALAALTALEREIGASLRPGLDHQVAHTRLAWWREECARSAQGRATHPLTRELTALFPQPGSAPLAGLGGLAGLVDLADWDLSRATFDTRRHLSAYCERWSGAVIVPLMRLATPGGQTAQAIALGATLREIELLLALAEDARAGRLRLPLAELAAAQLAPESLAHPPWPPALADLLRRRHGELRAALGAALEALQPAVRPALRGLIVWATLACTASARAEARLPRESGPREHHAPLDGWRAWRAARRVDKRRVSGEQTLGG
jgi:15-cis-phytoene synthase